jgi:hypothetical protein
LTFSKIAKLTEEIPGPGSYKSNKEIGEGAKSTKFLKEEKFSNKKIRPLTTLKNNNLTDNKKSFSTSKSQGNILKESIYVSENTLNNTIYKSNNFPGPAAYTPRKNTSNIGTK